MPGVCGHGEDEARQYSIHAVKRCRAEAPAATGRWWRRGGARAGRRGEGIGRTRASAQIAEGVGGVGGVSLDGFCFRRPRSRHRASVLRAHVIWGSYAYGARARRGGEVAEIDAVHENAPPLPPPRHSRPSYGCMWRPRENRTRSSNRLLPHPSCSEYRCLFSLEAKRNAQRECSACVPGSTSVRASWYVCRSADPRHGVCCVAEGFGEKEEKS